jgi:hypothetical protein
MGLQRVMWHARQRHAQVFAHRLGGERYLELPGHELRVIVESLVEVTEPKENNGLREAPLDLQVLAANGSAQTPPPVSPGNAAGGQSGRAATPGGLSVMKAS